MDKKQGIYEIQVVGAAQSYLGSTDNLERHWKREYLPRLRRSQHHNEGLQAAFNCFGEENVHCFLIEEVRDVAALGERELFWLIPMKQKGLVFNKWESGTAGMRGHRHSIESKKKMSEAKTGGKRSWIFLSPSGDIFQADMLNEFSRQHGLNSCAMCLVGNGKQKTHKGWKRIVPGVN